MAGAKDGWAKLESSLKADSDIDALIRFKSERTRGLFGIAGMQRELARLLARGVELVTRTAIEESSNYVHREAVLESARVVYTAPRLRVLPGHVAHRARRVFLYGAHVFRRRRAGSADAAVGSQVGGDSWRGLGAVDRRHEAATEIVYFRKSVGRMLSSPQLSVVHAAIRVTAQASRSSVPGASRAPGPPGSPRTQPLHGGDRSVD